MISRQAQWLTPDTSVIQAAEEGRWPEPGALPTDVLHFSLGPTSATFPSDCVDLLSSAWLKAAEVVRVPDSVCVSVNNPVHSG